jgi:dimethylamine/trimethylamine dehydrogenase
MAGLRPTGRSVLIYDDDHYVMANVLAELLVSEGYSVTYVTPVAEVATWTRNTMEQHRIQARLIELGVTIQPHRVLAAVDRDGVTLTCTFTGRQERRSAESVLLVTARLPETGLSDAVQARRDEWQAAGLRSVTLIGDALAPGTIAAATWSGRRYAEELDMPVSSDPVPFRREVAALLLFDVRQIVDATLPQA